MASYIVDDLALQALFVPVIDDLMGLRRDMRATLLRGRLGPALLQFQGRWPQLALTVEQSFRPFADALQAAGVVVTEHSDGQFPLVLVLPPRQRAEARAVLARALDLVTADGVVVASVANNEGARAIESDLRTLCGSVTTLSKHKCRVFWTQRAAASIDVECQQRWLQDDAPQEIEGGRFISRPGVFAWDRIDAASALLARHLPAGLKGRGADLGAGYGYLSSEVAQRCAGVQALDLYEAEARALALARINMQRVAARSAAPAFAFHWHDVTRGLNAQYDFIVSNPPFHQGRADMPELGRAFVRAAAQGLRPGGLALLVANRHLPYEQTLAAQFAQVTLLADEGGFKVIAATKAPA